MNATTTRERFAAMSPYRQRTVRSGVWCYEVDTYGLSESVRYAIHDRIIGFASTKYTSPSLGTYYVGSMAAARQIEAAARRHGGTARILRGKATFGARGYYDQCGCAFEEM